MIGIDITSIDRFAELPVDRLHRIAVKYHTEFKSAREAAKWWACHEAIIKCLGHSPDWETSKITFPEHSAPLYTGSENIKLSLSHESKLVVAVAIHQQMLT